MTHTYLGKLTEGFVSPCGPLTLIRTMGVIYLQASIFDAIL